MLLIQTNTLKIVVMMFVHVVMESSAFAMLLQRIPKHVLIEVLLLNGEMKKCYRNVLCHALLVKYTRNVAALVTKHVLS
jgi:hypothetical protein